MKPLLALICGFLASSAVFISGAAIATYLIVAEPARELDASADGADRRLAGDAEAVTQDVRRIPIHGAATRSGGLTKAAAGPSTAVAGEIDATPTAGVAPTGEIGDGQPSNALEANVAAHVKWCSARYRSYRPETNSYMAHSGEVRPCVSPFTATGEPAPYYAEEQLHVTNESPTLSADHIRDCLSRYRSYRPEDNTYQPYGGGPRRQCE